ncbi:polysaccharide pyruvyl transferase family protein [Prochlorococcus sp. MIT 1306]|uniref:polysaccharide pyruvyl transferase family protein n=1 Tax=Prochlorococcus sp. MIT 1306 TaxID=1799667 RepID=UPI0018D27B92|nr:polysaccharide pyruvyl transferase family protein [Prochlorococcus sp. MIT 1306]
MFDLDNYGDCLFPLIIKSRLDGLYNNLHFVSLTGHKTQFEDSVSSISFENAESLVNHGDIVIIGGGNVIGDFPLTFFEDQNNPYGKKFSGEDLWLTAIENAFFRQAKVVISAAGAFAPLKKSTLRRWEAVREQICYISWRDHSTWRICGRRNGEYIVPDIAMDHKLIQIITGCKHIKKVDEVLVNARPRSIRNDEFQQMCKTISRIGEKLDLKVRLIAISKSHADDRVAQEMSRHINGSVYSGRETSLCLATLKIARSRLVITSSLHVYIAAIAANCNSVVVERPRYNKFKGCRSHISKSGISVGDWSSLDGLIMSLDQAEGCIDDCQKKLDKHWNRITSILIGNHEQQRLYY